MGAISILINKIKPIGTLDRYSSSRHIPFAIRNLDVVIVEVKGFDLGFLLDVLVAIAVGPIVIVIAYPLPSGVIPLHASGTAATRA